MQQETERSFSVQWEVNIKTEKSEAASSEAYLSAVGWEIMTSNLQIKKLACDKASAYWL